MSAEHVAVTVNGRERSLNPGTTVATLVAELGPRPGAFAVEVNRAVVPATRHAEHRLQAGDVVEIVTFVGGG